MPPPSTPRWPVERPQRFGQRPAPRQNWPCPGNAIAAIKAKLATNARVRRDGKWLSRPAGELLLSVAGHLTIFQPSTRGPFWSTRPAPILLAAVCGIQALATLIAVYGLFMTPLGWRYAALVWGYALVWFLVTDPSKLLAYRILDPAAKPAPAVPPPAASPA